MVKLYKDVIVTYWLNDYLLGGTHEKMYVYGTVESKDGWYIIHPKLMAELIYEKYFEHLYLTFRSFKAANSNKTIKKKIKSNSDVRIITDKEEIKFLLGVPEIFYKSRSLNGNYYFYNSTDKRFLERLDELGWLNKSSSMIF